MSLEIYGLDLRLAKKMLFTGVNLRIDKPNLVVYVIDEAGLFIEGADVNILSAGHELDSVTDALGTALTRFMPAINNTLTVSKDGYATSTQIIYNETPSTLSVYVQLYASEIRLKVVNNQNEPIEGATCRVLNAIGGSNNVLSFDGVDDYVGIGHSSLMFQMPFSIEVMVNTKNLTSITLFSKSSTNGYDFLVNSNSGKIRFNMVKWPSTNQVVITDLDWELNTWYRFSVVQQSSGARFYINGQFVGEAINSTSFSTNTGDARIGSRIRGSLYFNAYWSDVRFWNIARTDGDILADWNKRLEGTEVGLTYYWKLDEGTGSTATDSAGSNDGTIYGATLQEADESFPLFQSGIQGYDPTPYDTGTTNANGLTTLNYQINALHGLEVTLPGKRRFIMPFQRTTRGLLDWQVMLSDYLATFATDRGNILINSEPENNDANFLIE